MSASKDITIRFKNSQTDNASDSLTTYSLMAVLAGSIFVQILAIDTNKLFITSVDKLLILASSGLSLLFLLIAIETAIDIFHFRVNNEKEEIKKKYKRQLNFYNKAVIILITVFSYMFWGYFIHKISDLTSAYFPNMTPNPLGVCLFIQYLILIICVGVTFCFSTKRWRRDLKFIRSANIIIHDVD